MGITQEGQQTPYGEYRYTTLRIFNLVMCWVALFLCVVLIAAMTLPLLSPKRRKKYSTYNLYLAYMVFPDFIVTGCVLYLSFVEQAIDPSWLRPEKIDGSHHPAEHSVILSCGTSNLYMNAFLTYEIYRLLKHSSIRKRHFPPTVARVTKQAGVSYALGILIAVVDYFLKKEIKEIQVFLLEVFEFVYVAIVPLSFMVGISVVMYKQQLLQSKRDMYSGKLRVLMLFFSRIILTDLLFWLPSSIFYLVYIMNYRQIDNGGDNIENLKQRSTFARNMSLLLHGCQTIVTFGFSLTKSDARLLIGDLFRCTCCRFGCSNFGPMDDDLRCYGDPSLRASYLPTTIMAFSPSLADASKLQNMKKSSDRNTSTQSDGNSSNSKDNLAMVPTEEPLTKPHEEGLTELPREPSVKQGDN